MNIHGFTFTLLVLNTYNDVGGLYTLTWSVNPTPYLHTTLHFWGAMPPSC
jgi:hypothetical protein